ncbi:response regulator [Geoalkalibacter halelectricus]|nr:response regulator [Geoalkalibacter halelectricus]
MSKKILITEDSPTMRAMICATLEALGDFDIFEAANGFEALRLLPRESFDLVITDINMPDINGLELVSFIKRNDQYKTIPLVIVSTEGSERDREKGLKLGANAYLVKPFSPEELQKLVEKFLE